MIDIDWELENLTEDVKLLIERMPTPTSRKRKGWELSLNDVEEKISDMFEIDLLSQLRRRARLGYSITYKKFKPELDSDWEECKVLLVEDVLGRNREYRLARTVTEARAKLTVSLLSDLLKLYMYRDGVIIEPIRIFQYRLREGEDKGGITVVMAKDGIVTFSLCNPDSCVFSAEVGKKIALGRLSATRRGRTNTLYQKTDPRMFELDENDIRFKTLAYNAMHKANWGPCHHVGDLVSYEIQGVKSE